MILSQLATVPGFQGIFFTESADAEFARQMAAHPKAPACLTGRISVDSILQSPISNLRSPPSTHCPPSSVFYLSGPPVMLATLGNGLRAAGVPPERIRTDAWE